MKYNGVSFKGIWPRVRAKKVYRKLARKQERRFSKEECNILG